MTPPLSIDAAGAARLLAAGEAVLVDVREPDEFKAEHIALAASLPLGALREQFAGLPLPEGRAVIFQCLKGGRGGQACAIAGTLATGRQLFNLDGGIAAWKQAGLPVVRAAGAGVPSIFRQVQMIVGVLVLIGVVAGFAGYGAGFALAGLLGAALALAGLTGWCGLALLLSRMPWNGPA